MKKTLVITDVTQMPREFSNGNEVCVVGIDETGHSIRPINKNGFLKDYLVQNRLVIIRPGAKVEFDLQRTNIAAPHIEDMEFDPSSIVSKGFCSSSEWENTLQHSSFSSVKQIYDGHLQGNGWVLPGAKTRSIATLSDATINSISLTGNNFKPRIKFSDPEGNSFDRPASDLALWNKCFYQIKKQGKDPTVVVNELVTVFQNSERLFLRVGLARPWAVPGSGELKCYLQVTGIYTFPDYLQGKTFADFLG